MLIEWPLPAAKARRLISWRHQREETPATVWERHAVAVRLPAKVNA